MAAIPEDITPAERARLRPRAASHAVFQHVRRQSADEFYALTAASPLDNREVAELREQVAELARDAGLVDGLKDASSRARSGCRAMLRRAAQQRAGARGARDFDWMPDRRRWDAVTRRVQLHTESLVVDEELSPEMRQRCRLPTLPARLV